MDSSHKKLLPIFLFCALLPCVAPAQESLDLLLERGYVSHWLVCGPFQADVEGGIEAAVKAGRPPLGDQDFMKPLGGIARLRPQHLQVVENDAGDSAVWQRAGTEDHSLDLAPFFPLEKEGISYAGFYATSEKAQDVFIDLQSPLGLRVWLNGLLIRPIEAAPVVAAGVDQFVARFRPGKNFFVVEAPGAHFESLAEMAGMTVRELGGRGFMNRPLIKGESGFEIALGLRPAQALGDLYFVPVLEDAGAFSGSAGNVRQDVFLTLYNASENPSPAVDLAVTGEHVMDSLFQRVSAIEPKTAWRERLAVPTGNAMAGQEVPVTVRMMIYEDTPQEQGAQFTTSLKVAETKAGGRVYVITGQEQRVEDPEDQATEIERKNSSYIRQAMLAEREARYGFDLGPLSVWKSAVELRPEARGTIEGSIGMARCATWPVHSLLDERVVTGETLIRNLAYGVTTAKEILYDEGQSYLAWNTPGLAPQSPQLFRWAELPGMISNLEYPGLRPLAYQMALDGGLFLHRRKQANSGPTSLDGMRQMAALQRRELFDQGFSSDLLVHESLTQAPEPFFIGAAEELANAYPAVLLQGRGGKSFFEDLDRGAGGLKKDLPRSGRFLTARYPGALVSHPWLKMAYARVEQQVTATEKMATFAALLGATYPNVALDLAWRQLLYWGHSDRLSTIELRENYVDALAGIRDAAEVSNAVRVKALDYIAREIDTLSTAPPHAETMRALIVFNSNSWERSALCETHLDLGQAAGLSLYDDTGKTIAFSADRLQMLNARSFRSARIRFVAEKIPALGYRTFYLQGQGRMNAPSLQEDAQIENDRFLLVVDPTTGAIQSLVNKQTGKEYAQGFLNQIVALAEQGSRTNGGRELWTLDVDPEIAEATISIETRIESWMQQISVRSSFLGGVLEREYSVYDGLDYVDCRCRLKNVNIDETLLAAVFQTPHEGCTPVFGERLGALIGRRSRESFNFKSQGLDNPSGTGAQPALQWVALSPNDHFRIGAQGALPFGPVAIIVDKEELFLQQALQLQSAFVKRGFPAEVWADHPEKPDLLWTDSTVFRKYDDDLDHATAMRIVLGSPEQSDFCARLIEALPEKAVKDFSKRLNQGAVLLLEDEKRPEKHAPVPSLILAGLLPERTVSLLDDFTESVAATGSYIVPPSACLIEEPDPYPEAGLALLFNGSKLCSVERNGSLVMALTHGTSLQDDHKLGAPDTTFSFRYAIKPFEGDWRSAALPRAARDLSEPLWASQTDNHAGHQPSAQSLISVAPEDLIITGIKSAGYPQAAMSVAERHPRNGIVMHAFESTGKPWKGQIDCFVPLRNAAYAGIQDRPRSNIPVRDNSLFPEVSSFGVNAFWFLATSYFNQGEVEALGRTKSPYGPIPTRYWLHNTGAAPLGFQPLSILLRGDLSPEESTVEAIISNNLSDRSIEGVVYLKAAEGWSLGPAQFYYKLEAGEWMKKEAVVLCASGDPKTGGVVAWTHYNDQLYRDSMEVLEKPYTMTVSRNESQVKVSIRNQSGVAAEGFVDLVTTPEYWAECAMPPVVSVMPRRAAVSIPPFKSQDLVFRFSDPEARPWAVIKLAANGHVLYQKIP